MLLVLERMSYTVLSKHIDRSGISLVLVMDLNRPDLVQDSDRYAKAIINLEQDNLLTTLHKLALSVYMPMRIGQFIESHCLL